jgi:hypothetical protein
LVVPCTSFFVGSVLLGDISMRLAAAVSHSSRKTKNIHFFSHFSQIGSQRKNRKIPEKFTLG